MNPLSVTPQSTAAPVSAASPAQGRGTASAKAFDRVLSSSVDDERPRDVDTARRAGQNDGNRPSSHAPAAAGKAARAVEKRAGGDPKAAAATGMAGSKSSPTPVSKRAMVQAAPPPVADDAEGAEPAPSDAVSQGLADAATPSTTSPDLAASGALPAALLISLTAPAAATVATQGEATTTDTDAAAVAAPTTGAVGNSAGGSPAPVPNGATAALADAATTGRAAPLPAAAGGSGAAASAGGTEDLEANVAADGSEAEAGEAATAGSASSATSSDVPAPPGDRAARQLARKILGQVVSAASPQRGPSDQAAKDPAAAAGTIGVTLDGVSPDAAIDRAAPGAGHREGAALARDRSAGADTPLPPDAAFPASSDDAGQDQRGGTPRGTRSWSAGWPVGSETLRTAPKASGDHAAGVALPVAVPGDSAAAFGVALTAAAGTSEAGGQAPAVADVEMARQVVRAVSLAWRDQVGEARLHLTPDHLGEVTVSLRVERGVVSAVLQADTAAARDWIRTHESELRQGLEGQGLHLDSLVVTEDGTPQGGQEQQAPPRKRPPMPATIGADAPRFEVRV